MRKVFAILIFITVFITGAVLSAANTHPVTIYYYFGSLTISVSIVIVVALMTGILIGAAVISLSRWRLRYENHRLQKKLATLEQEINNLRTLPLKDLD